MKLIGLCRIGKDAELRYTPSGTAVCNLSLAYNYGRKDESGDQPTQWLDASLWGKRAEALHQYLTKGTLLLVEADDVHVETYTGKNGAGAALRGNVSDIQFAGGKPADNKQAAAGDARAYREASGGGRASSAPGLPSDDIPFAACERGRIA